MLANHFFFQFRQFLRQPSYMVSTMVFPAIFFICFALENAKTPETAHFLMGSFAAYAVLSVCFLQFGVGVAQERASHWNQFLVSLPFPYWVLIVAKALTALVFALFAAWALIAVVFSTTDAVWNVSHFFAMNSALVLGGLPFCLMGLCLGWLTNENSALPICNLFYLTMSFAGGLWIPPNALSQTIQDYINWLPTYHYGLVVRSTVLDKPLPTDSVNHLALVMVAMIAITILLHKRSKQFL